MKGCGSFAFAEARSFRITPLEHTSSAVSALSDASFSVGNNAGDAAQYSHDMPPTTRKSFETQKRDVDRALTRVRRFAYWLDSRFKLPGTDIRFGLDTLVGLVPVVGDTATLVVGLLPVVESLRLGVRKRTTARMLANLGVDWVVGLVPGVDLIVDTAFKAHLRNARLLEAELQNRVSDDIVASERRSVRRSDGP